MCAMSKPQAFIFTWIVLGKGILFDAGKYFSNPREFDVLWNILTLNNSENIIVKYLSNEQWLAEFEKQLQFEKKIFIISI